MSRSARERIDARLSGVTMSDESKAKVLAYARKGEKKMKKKVSAGLALAIALMALIAGTALAAANGVFGLFAQSDSASGGTQHGALEAKLEEAATAEEGQSQHFSGLTVTVNQTFYDGEVLYIAWTEEREGEAAQHVSIGDGIELADGTYLNPRMSGDQSLQDGVSVHWMRYDSPLPEAARDKDALDLQFRISDRSAQDGKPVGHYMPVRVPRNSDVHTATYKQTFENYSAAYRVTADILSGVAIEVSVTLSGVPEDWYDAVVTMQKPADAILTYRLYADGKACEQFLGGVGGEGTQLTYDGSFLQPEGAVQYMLVPEYTQSGEHPEEAFSFDAQELTGIPVNQ